MAPQAGIYSTKLFRNDGNYFSDATAMVDSELLVIYREDFLPLLESRPGLAIRLIEVVCGRLRDTSKLRRSTDSPSAVGPSPTGGAGVFTESAASSFPARAGASGPPGSEPTIQITPATRSIRTR